MSGASGGLGVVLVHDRDGLDPHVVEYAEELGMAGFAVETVDLHAGLPTSDPAGGDGLAAAVSGSEAVAVIAAAAQRLRGAGATAVGALGFCLGGDLVLHAARDGMVDAVVAYDAAGPAEDAALTRCPVQLHLAGTGGPRDAGSVAAYVAALRAAGTPVDVFTYPGVHGSADPDVPAWDAHSADVARLRALGFLRARLDG